MSSVNNNVFYQTIISLPSANSTVSSVLPASSTCGNSLHSSALNTTKKVATVSKDLESSSTSSNSSSSTSTVTIAERIPESKSDDKKDCFKVSFKTIPQGVSYPSSVECGITILTFKEQICALSKAKHPDLNLERLEVKRVGLIHENYNRITEGYQVEELSLYIKPLEPEVLPQASEIRVYTMNIQYFGGLSQIEFTPPITLLQLKQKFIDSLRTTHASIAAEDFSLIYNGARLNDRTLINLAFCGQGDVRIKMEGEKVLIKL